MTAYSAKTTRTPKKAGSGETKFLYECNLTEAQKQRLAETAEGSGFTPPELLTAVLCSMFRGEYERYFGFMAQAIREIEEEMAE